MANATAFANTVTDGDAENLQFLLKGSLNFPIDVETRSVSRLLLALQRSKQEDFQQTQLIWKTVAGLCSNDSNVNACEVHSQLMTSASLLDCVVSVRRNHRDQCF